MPFLGVGLYCLRIVFISCSCRGKRDAAQVLDDPPDTLDREAVRACNYISFLGESKKIGAVRVTHGPRVIAVKEESVLAVTLELLSSDDLLAVNGLLEQKDNR